MYDQGGQDEPECCAQEIYSSHDSSRKCSILIDEPIRSNLCRTIYNKRLPNCYQNGSKYRKIVPSIHLYIQEYPHHVQTGTDQETGPQSFCVDYVIGRKVRQRVNQKRDYDRCTDVSIRYSVQVSQFTSNRYDCIIAQTIDKETEAHKCNNDPPIRVLDELSFGSKRIIISWLFAVEGIMILRFLQILLHNNIEFKYEIADLMRIILINKECIIIYQKAIKQDKVYMQLIEKYIKKHHDHMRQVFASMGKDQTIEATKVFSFIQTAFNLQHFVFMLSGDNYFENQDNSSQIQKLIERYYRKNQTDSTKKFYLYRIYFTFEEVGDIIEFWLHHEPNLKIIYKQFGQAVKQQQKVQDKKQQDDNEFDMDVDQLPKILEECKKTRDEYLSTLQKGDLQKQKEEETFKQLQQVQYKIKTLEQRIKAQQQTKSTKKEEKQTKLSKKNSINTNKELSPANSNSSKKSKKPSGVINYKGIFEFYSKQNHLTGGKATFDRIQHESQTLNYQKLVHFLRQFGLMPAKTSQQKQVHRLYIKTCDKTRDLNYKTFLTFLDGLAEIIFKNEEGEKKELMKERILKKKKEGKMLHFPFHILVSEDFRIVSKQIKYQFKIKPQYGKLEEQINDELEVRRKIKNEEKQEKDRKREIKKLRYLKKLESIDPFHPDVVKNSKLLDKSVVISEPIASLDNIERYRDDKFDFKSHFGLDVGKSDLFQRNRANSGRNKVYEKMQRIEKGQAQKLKNLMSGIIERSNAKLQKLGLPNKGVKFL